MLVGPYGRYMSELYEVTMAVKIQITVCSTE